MVIWEFFYRAHECIEPGQDYRRHFYITIIYSFHWNCYPQSFSRCGCIWSAAALMENFASHSESTGLAALAYQHVRVWATIRTWLWVQTLKQHSLLPGCTASSQVATQNHRLLFNGMHEPLFQSFSRLLLPPVTTSTTADFCPHYTDFKLRLR